MAPGGMTISGKHTYRDLQMIPKSKITINPPQPRFEYESLVGVTGSIDHSDFLTGRVSLGSRKGTLEFLVLSGVDYHSAYDMAKKAFDGAVKDVVLDDDPSFTYRGRFWVSDWKSWEGYSMIAVEYDVEPYRYSGDDIYTEDWLFDDIIENNKYIYYGSFAVSGMISRTLVNPSNTAIKPRFSCTAPVTVKIGGVSYRLAQGDTTEPGFVLRPGVNQMEFYGNATVEIHYDREVRV